MQPIHRSSRRPAARIVALTLALAMALVPAQSEAIAPALLFMLKQIAQEMAKSMLKDALLSALSGMGCKGIALANALEALGLRRGAGGAGGLAGVAGMPGMMGGSLARVPVGAVPTDVAAKMSALMPGLGRMPAGMALAPDQMAMMAGLQQAMGEPLSPTQTLAVIDELADLGFLPEAVQAELKECMVVVPASIAALGMGMGMLKPIVPQLRQAREQMRSLSPAEQDEVAAALAAEIAPLPAAQRVEFVEHLGSGFFPPRISDGVKQRLAAK